MMQFLKRFISHLMPIEKEASRQKPLKSETSFFCSDAHLTLHVKGMFQESHDAL